GGYYRTMDMSRRNEIKGIFNGVFPNLEPNPNHLEYLCSLVKDYALRETGFSVELRRGDALPEGSFCTYSYDAENLLMLTYKMDDNILNEQLNFSLGLAFVVLVHVPPNTPIEPDITNEHLFYFAQRLLTLYADMDNGSFLRSRYAASKSMISDKVSQYCVHEEHHREYVDRIFEEVFPYDKTDVEYLRDEKQDILEYIKNNRGLQNFTLNVKEGDAYESPKGVTLSGDSKESIWYTPAWKIEKYLWIKDEFRKYRDLDAHSIVALIHAHEFAHLVLHYRDRRDRIEEELEAFYFAKLLLQRCELRYAVKLNYANPEECPEYKDAINKWKVYMTQLYEMLSTYDPKKYPPENIDTVWEDGQAEEPGFAVTTAAR
ncbi:MAG: hypothetical protein FWH00_04370, partial [Oscillospiraceae bacterium]|nr:hypothetical protein [Oscillospiraceae bacterium]